MLREDPELASRQKPETEKRDRAEDQSLSLSDLSVSSRPPSMLRADPELPFLEMAWSPSHMQQFLNRQVLPAVWPGQEVTAVSLEDMTYKASKQCEILYSLQFADPTWGQSRWAGVTFAKKNKLRTIYSRRHCGGAAAQPTPPPVVFLPESGCLIEFFPRDWGLPYLARAMEPEEIASLLSQGGPAAERSRGLPKVEVLRYRFHKRCVLRYVLDTPGGGAPQEVIGKVHNSGPLTVQVAQVQSILQAQGAAYGIIIPKPLRVIEEWGLLLMEQLVGTVMKSVVEETRAPERAKEAIGLAAATLARLHRFRFESQEVLSLQTQLKKFRKRAASLHLIAPLLAQQMEALLQQIARLGAQFTTVAYSFIHGGFHPGQLLMDEGQIGIVDFDSACLGDPAIDVGKFMVSLHYRAVSRANNAFRQLAMYFLSEYQARVPEHRVAERIHLFLSAALIRRALRAFERRPYEYGQAGSDSLPALLLQEAAACLSRH